MNLVRIRNEFFFNCVRKTFTIQVGVGNLKWCRQQTNSWAVLDQQTALPLDLELSMKIRYLIFILLPVCGIDYRACKNSKL